MVEPSPLTVRSVQFGGSSARGLQHANLIWGIAELLRGDYKHVDYGKVILPLVVMRPTRPGARGPARRPPILLVLMSHIGDIKC